MIAIFSCNRKNFTFRWIGIAQMLSWKKNSLTLVVPVCFLLKFKNRSSQNVTNFGYIFWFHFIQNAFFKSALNPNTEIWIRCETWFTSMLRRMSPWSSTAKVAFNISIYWTYQILQINIMWKFERENHSRFISKYFPFNFISFQKWSKIAPKLLQSTNDNRHRNIHKKNACNFCDGKAKITINKITMCRDLFQVHKGNSGLIFSTKPTW